MKVETNNMAYKQEWEREVVKYEEIQKWKWIQQI